MAAVKIELRPGITNPNLWHPDRPDDWEAVRKAVLKRDNHTCLSCGHRALKWMNIHHLKASEENDLDNLATLCVACHAVMHLGFSMMYGAFAVYRAEESQLEIVQRTRALVAKEMSLPEINKTFTLTEGHYPPESLDYASDLVNSVGRKSRATLKKPLSVVFVKFKRWQIEPV